MRARGGELIVDEIYLGLIYDAQPRSRARIRATTCSS